MKNTLFKKLLYFYFVIILLSFLILGLGFSQLFSNYYFDRQEKVLINEGKKINYLVIDYLNGQISEERLELELKALEKFLNTKTWIINQKAIIYGVSSGEKKWIGKEITAIEMLQVLEGKIITKKGVYHEKNNIPLLTVAMPIYINGKVTNAIIMHTPIYEVTNVISEVHRIVIISMIIAFIGAFILLWIVSKKISKPLKQLSMGAREISNGKFNYHIDLKEEGELGQVISTFNQMTKKLDKIEKNRKSFIAALAHELKSPLTIIKGYTQAIVDKTIRTDDQDKYLNIILDESHRLNNLITNLLDVQKMETGKYPIQKSRFNIKELIGSILISYEERIKSMDMELHLDLQENIFVMADKDAIKQVIINLLENSFKFKKINPKIYISTKGNKNKCIVTIQDNGVGIEKENIPNIWDEFYKEDKSRNRKNKGSGLGLYIVKKIIHIHKEEISIDSELGKGTIFKFTLNKVF